MSKETFFLAYLETAFFADMPEGAAPNAVMDDESLADMRETANAFYDANQEDIESYCEGLEQAGHDLWFTQQGHGCGYWEQDDDVSKRLYKAAKLIPERWLGVADDGSLFIN